MKKIFICLLSSVFVLFFFAFSTYKAQAQLTVVQGAALTMTPLQLVQQVLVGNGVTVSNATFNGSAATISSNQVGSFTTAGTATTQLGFTGGIILASGTAITAIGPNSTTGAGSQTGTGSDPDLYSLSSYTIYDKAVLEFDFVPISDTVRFRYVFGSEEFDTYCNSSYNDVFGFFISGPGISGPFSNNAQNIALMPGSSNYVTINNVCNCSGGTCSWWNSGGIYYQYNRLTHVLTAMCIVQPCQQYHIKLAVGDAGDGILDSGVFLEENSFSSNGLSFNTSYSSNIDTVAVEGCNNAIITFHLGQPAADTIIIHYSIGGTAIEGVDYPDIADSLIIPTGQDSAYFVIQPISDGIAEPAETVNITYVNTVCGSTDTIAIIIKDYTPLATTVTPEVHSCDGQAATISVSVTGGFTPPPITYEWSESAGNTASVMVNPPTPTMYYVTVSDACNFFTIDSVMVSISNLSNLVTNIDSVTCYGYSDGSATITASNGLTPYHYFWSPTNDTTATASNLSAGTYFVTVTDDIGCTSTNFVILDSPPEIGLLLTPTDETCLTFCNGSIATQITGSYSQPVSYLWNTSPAQTSATATNLCPGNYSVTLTYSSHNCLVINNADIITQTQLSADFVADSVEGFVPFTVNFTYTGFGASTYDWDFGDGSQHSTQQNPSHVYQDMGTYYAILVINSGAPNYCESEHQIVIEAMQPSSMLVPNIFTPNADGKNDVFQIESEGIKTIDIAIFNRWGKKVYDLNANDFTVVKEKKDIWNGTSKSEGVCADGTYFYIIDAVGYDKKEYHLQGTISLLR